LSHPEGHEVYMQWHKKKFNLFSDTGVYKLHDPQGEANFDTRGIIILFSFYTRHCLMNLYQEFVQIIALGSKLAPPLVNIFPYMYMYIVKFKKIPKTTIAEV
jgi:hypothetical protein